MTDRRSPPITLATLDLSQPAERQAHDFLCRATSKRDRMWSLFDLRRHKGVLLCAVRWVHPDDASKPFALAEVSLTEPAVCWRDYATAEARGTNLRDAARSQRRPIARPEADSRSFIARAV